MKQAIQSLGNSNKRVILESIFASPSPEILHKKCHERTYDLIITAYLDEDNNVLESVAVNNSSVNSQLDNNNSSKKKSKTLGTKKLLGSVGKCLVKEELPCSLLVLYGPEGLRTAQSVPPSKVADLFSPARTAPKTEAKEGDEGVAMINIDKTH